MTTHTSPLGKIGLILLVTLPLLLAGCGQKGKLYHPDQASSQTQPQA